MSPNVLEEHIASIFGIRMKQAASRTLLASFGLLFGHEDGSSMFL
jgi:hypothetical protein